MNLTNFQQDIQYGKIGEKIFKDDFLDFLNIKYINVTNCQQFQIIDSDYLSKIGLYEIKLNYKDNNQIVIEEYTNINEKLGNLSLGWFYNSKADLIIFISKQTRNMIFLPFKDEFKFYYESIKKNCKLIRNKISYYNNQKWQSAFRFLPLNNISGYYSIYKKSIKEDYEQESLY